MLPLSWVGQGRLEALSPMQKQASIPRTYRGPTPEEPWSMREHEGPRLFLDNVLHETARCDSEVWLCVIGTSVDSLCVVLCDRLGIGGMGVLLVYLRLCL